MIEVLTGFGVVVVVIAVGYLLGRTDALGPGARRALANLV
ncbi:MAG: AEC family transporter, partial [Corynebacterium marinum]|nr:AEC family transporter [Corynebacterium marinum]